MCRELWSWIFFAFCICFHKTNALSIKLNDPFEQKMANDLMSYLDSGNKSTFLNTNMHRMIFPADGKIELSYDFPRQQKDLVCTSCRIAFGVILSLIGARATDTEIIERSISLCGILGYGEPIVCRQTILFNALPVLHILRNSKGLSSDYLCGTIFQGSCGYTDTSRDFRVKIDGNGPPINGHKSEIPSSAEELTILHITDTHHDPKYQIGSNANCNYPTCCRVEHTTPSNPADRAGRWGDYRDCDMPWESIQDLFDQTKTHKNVDVVYMTGDFIDHAVWDTSFEGNKANIRRTSEAMRSAFPNIPVFPSIGNHEPHPVNLFSPNSIQQSHLTTTPLYQFIADTWNWLPNTARQTLIYGGYYTAEVRPGLRVVSLNNNLCNTYNFWHLYQPSYMEDQLQWLHDTLLEAERIGEKVHIIGHMNSGGGDCINVWGREYRRVVDRFWNTISGQFVGHTHKDEFNIYYAKDNPQHAINVAWNGGSATTYSWVNPNYRLYSVEKQTYQVTDHETWIYNLTEANQGSSSPRWFKEYSFKQEYNVPDLSPASLDQLAKNFVHDNQLMLKYWQNYVKMGDPHLEQGCNSDCLFNTFCRIVTTEYFDKSKCNDFYRYRLTGA